MYAVAESLCRMRDDRDSERQKGRERLLVFHLIIIIIRAYVNERTQYIKSIQTLCGDLVVYGCECVYAVRALAWMCACSRWYSRVMQNNEPSRLGESVALNHFLFCSHDFIPRLSDKRLVFSSIHIFHYINEAIERTNERKEEKHRSYLCERRVTHEPNISFEIFVPKM